MTQQTQEEREQLGLMRLLLETALGIGEMSEVYGIHVAQVGDELVVLFCERTGEGLFPLAELRPANRIYTLAGETGGNE